MKNLQSAMPSRRTALAALVIVVMIAMAVVFAIRSNVAAQSVNSDWPSLTMTYETTGQSTMVGRTLQSGTEVRRMEYTSKGSWTDTITEASDVVTSLGTFNPTGSFRSLGDGVITEYDAITGHTSTVDAIEGVAHLAGAAFARRPIDKLQERGFEFTRVETDARVCFESVCEDNAVGIRLEINNQEYLFVDDVRGIPLKRGAASFKVLEVSIDGEKRAVDLD
jgi:hypothetical protein